MTVSNSARPMTSGSTGTLEKAARTDCPPLSPKKGRKLEVHSTGSGVSSRMVTSARVMGVICTFRS